MAHPQEPRRRMSHDWTGCIKEQHPALVWLPLGFCGRHVPALLHPITSLISEVRMSHGMGSWTRLVVKNHCRKKGHFQAVAWLKAPQHWSGSEASSPLISKDHGFTCVRVEHISSPQSTTRLN